MFQSLILKKDEVKELDLAQEGKGLAYMGVIVLYAIGFSKSFVVSTSLLGGITLAMQKDKKPAALRHCCGACPRAVLRLQ